MHILNPDRQSLLALDHEVIEPVLPQFEYLFPSAACVVVKNAEKRILSVSLELLADSGRSILLEVPHQI